ncbi:hypothetical protein N0V84_004818 [Fusarium piperis]|uniref:3-beta hydroxysteroid dehydrogenase/isomerase domain-containing protein n=1 Tax=Fusarium piperis TaxID=1435070 RepID=A0A9W8WEY2_9HYPO|nr:hypothetical protein N0V84_004818 [Fusarium piperis]
MIPDPSLPKDSLVTISGANGFIASHISDLLLSLGYRVRGTVRDVDRAAWLSAHFSSQYGQGRFSLVAVPDVANEGAFDDALAGVDGAIHTIAVTNLDPDPDNVVPVNVASTLGFARSANKAETVKRLVYTSSSGAAAIPKPGEKYVVNSETYNEEAVAIAYSRQVKGPAGGYLAYSAAKTKAEQALWKWYAEEKPKFVLNSVVPNAALGKVLLPERQGFPTAVGLVKTLWEGRHGPELVHMVPPPRIHVAALLFSDVQSERLISYGGPFNLNSILATFREAQPERAFPDDFPNTPEDIGEIHNERATELLKRLGRPGWTSLKDCLGPLVKQYAAAEKA